MASRNKEYEDRQDKKGLKKVTVWLPFHAVDDAKDMCITIKEEYLNNRREIIPFMIRDLATGKFGRF